MDCATEITQIRRFVLINVPPFSSECDIYFLSATFYLHGAGFCCQADSLLGHVLSMMVPTILFIDQQNMLWHLQIVTMVDDLVLHLSFMVPWILLITICFVLSYSFWASAFTWCWFALSISKHLFQVEYCLRDESRCMK